MFVLIVDGDAVLVECLEAGVGDGVEAVECVEAFFEALVFGACECGECEGVGGLFVVGGEEPVAEFVCEVEALCEGVGGGEGEAVDEEGGVAVAVDLDGGGAEAHEVGVYGLDEWRLKHGVLFFAEDEDEGDDEGDAAEDDDGEGGAVGEGEGAVGFVDGAVGVFG